MESLNNALYVLLQLLFMLVWIYIFSKSLHRYLLFDRYMPDGYWCIYKMVVAPIFILMHAVIMVSKMGGL